MVVRRSLAVVSLALIPSLAGAASGVQRAPSVIGASDALRSSQPAVGSAVVASLVLLFAGVSLGHLGWRRSRARRQQTDDVGALDNTPRNETVTKIFLKYAPAQVAALGQALEAGDSAQITARAHKLKGSCLAIGAPRMAELCALLESGTSDGSGLYAELCRSLVHAERELTEQLVIGAGGTSQH